MGDIVQGIKKVKEGLWEKFIVDFKLRSYVDFWKDMVREVLGV